MAKNGVVGEFTLNPGTAADGRHQAFVTTVTLPEDHPALPFGTILAEGEDAGTAVLATATAENQELLGVVNENVEAGEGIADVMIHGSCTSEILVTVADNGTATAASPELVKALRRGNGIYV